MFAALTTAADPIEIARAIGGTAFVAKDDETNRPYEALVIGDDRAALEAIADFGFYRVELRRMRHQRRFWPADEASPGLVAVFTNSRALHQTHEEHDAYLRDVHAPLALRHHAGMWHYHQLSVQEVLVGPFFDSIVLLGFASEQEYAERFFGNDDDVAAIMADAPKFVNMPPLLASVRTTEWRFGPD